MKNPVMKKVFILGMELEQWKYKSCKADVAVGDDWATLYAIQSKIEGQGHATTLLKYIKKYYEAKKLRFGGTVALNERMTWIYKKLKIKEYF